MSSRQLRGHTRVDYKKLHNMGEPTDKSEEVAPNGAEISDHETEESLDISKELAEVRVQEAELEKMLELEESRARVKALKAKLSVVKAGGVTPRVADVSTVPSVPAVPSVPEPLSGAGLNLGLGAPSLPVTVSRKRTATVKTKKGKKPKGGGGVQKLAESLSK